MFKDKCFELFLQRSIFLLFPPPWGEERNSAEGKKFKKKERKDGERKKRKKRDKRGKKREGKKNYVKRRRNILSLYFESGKENLKDISAWWYHYFLQLLKGRGKITFYPKIFKSFPIGYMGKKSDILEKFSIFPLYWELSLISPLYFKF